VSLKVFIPLTCSARPAIVCSLSNFPANMHIFPITHRFNLVCFSANASHNLCADIWPAIPSNAYTSHPTHQHIHDRDTTDSRDAFSVQPVDTYSLRFTLWATLTLLMLFNDIPSYLSKLPFPQSPNSWQTSNNAVAHDTDSYSVDTTYYRRFSYFFILWPPDCMVLKCLRNLVLATNALTVLVPTSYPPIALHQTVTPYILSKPSIFCQFSLEHSWAIFPTTRLIYPPHSANTSSFIQGYLRYHRPTCLFQHLTLYRHLGSLLQILRGHPIRPRSAMCKPPYIVYHTLASGSSLGCRSVFLRHRLQLISWWSSVHFSSQPSLGTSES
jgi:hypothetical protein